MRRPPSEERTMRLSASSETVLCASAALSRSEWVSQLLYRRDPGGLRLEFARETDMIETSAISYTGMGLLKTWCGQARIVANESSQDERGWDVFLQLPSTNELVGGPLDRLPPRLSCMVQVKPLPPPKRPRRRDRDLRQDARRAAGPALPARRWAAKGHRRRWLRRNAWNSSRAAVI